MSTIKADAWPTCVACAPAEGKAPLTVAVGLWNGDVQIFSIADNVEKKHTIKAHDGRCEAIEFTPDGKWIFTGGSDRKVFMWDAETGKKTLTFNAPAPVHAIVACPTRAWVCAATYEGIAVWDIQNKQQIDLVVAPFKSRGTKRDEGRKPDCLCLSWAADGTVLYAGYNDGMVRAWEVRESQ